VLLRYSFKESRRLKDESATGVIGEFWRRRERGTRDGVQGLETSVNLWGKLACLHTG
jgi:hypothetical protein